MANQYVVKMDARNLPTKKTDVFTNMFESDDAKRHIITKSKDGLQVIGELKLFNLVEFDLSYNPLLRKNVFLTLIIHDVNTNKFLPLEDYSNVSLTNTLRYDSFLRKIRY